MPTRVIYVNPSAMSKAEARETVRSLFEELLRTKDALRIAMESGGVEQVCGWQSPHSFGWESERIVCAK